MLYIVDISEQCGHTIQQQAALFHSIKPLFTSKPLMIVLNKIDATLLESLPEEDRAVLKEMSIEALKSTAAGRIIPGLFFLHSSSVTVMHTVEFS